MKEKLKDNKTLLIVGVFLVLVAILGVSYAFFSAIIIGNEDAGENIVKAGSMKLIFVDDKDKEIKRLIGEIKKEEILDTIKELGGNLWENI